MIIGGGTRKIRRAVRTEQAASELARTQTIDATVNPHRLADQLMRLDARKEEREYPSYLRCSSLHDVCVREHVLGWRHSLKYAPYIDSSMMFTFEIGHAVHSRLQNNPLFFGDDLLGWWRCPCGVVRFGRRPNKPCPRCYAAAEKFVYEEHAVKTKDPWRLTGHIDALLEVGAGDARIVDFKTINGDAFDKLERPHADHVMQIHGYLMSLDHEKNLPITVNREKALVMYFSKQHKVKCLPVKAFHVTRVAHVEETITNMLQEHKHGIEDETHFPAPLPRCVASGFTDYRSKNCPAREFCIAACSAT